MGAIVLLGHIGLVVGLEVFVIGLGVFVCGAPVGFGGYDFFLRGVDVGVVEGGLNQGSGLWGRLLVG